MTAMTTPADELIERLTNVTFFVHNQRANPMPATEKQLQELQAVARDARDLLQRYREALEQIIREYREYGEVGIDVMFDIAHTALSAHIEEKG